MFSVNCRKAALLLYLVGTGVASGQQFSYGVKGGVALNEPTRYGRDESKRYVAGVTAELGFWRGFAVEVDLLYRRNGSGVAFNSGRNLLETPNGTVYSYAHRLRWHVLELPVLGKYYFRREGKVQPFVLTGYTLSKAKEETNSEELIQSSGGVSTRLYNSSSWTPTDIGVSFGAGARWRSGRVSFTPEIRYTYRGEHRGAASPEHQTDFLLGITF